jgi:hypothetical protein
VLDPSSVEATCVVSVVVGAVAAAVEAVCVGAVAVVPDVEAVWKWKLSPECQWW